MLQYIEKVAIGKPSLPISEKMKINLGGKNAIEREKML
jgi:hypothetical protein